jgi:hypothetical protein
VENDVTMSAPDDTVFGANSAGIEIRGGAQESVVLSNRIRGRARAALALIQGKDAPRNNRLVSNDIEGFHGSLAGVFVDKGVTNTLVIGRKCKIQDRGVGTVAVRSRSLN